jgi:hypothetical protein
LLIFLVLFGTFNIVVKMGKRKLKSDQYQYQTNIIKIDRYLYNDTTPKKVILGSSLSARLVPDSIPGISNLALAGMSIFDGFNIIARKSTFPKVIFIETNIITRGESPVLKEVLNSNVNYKLKGTFPALRDEYQPVGMIKGILYKYKKEVHEQQSVNPELFNELLADQLKQYSNKDTTSIHKATLQLKAEVKKLESHGITVCFFEMPINNKLSTSPYANNMRQEITRTFPHNNFISMPSEHYTTVDGLHLVPIEAAKYSAYFESQASIIK